MCEKSERTEKPAERLTLPNRGNECVRASRSSVEDEAMFLEYANEDLKGFSL